MNPRVTDVKPMPGHELILTFNNGELRRFDCKPYLELGVFKELKDERYFAQVRPAFGAVEWPHEQDINPDTLYLKSEKVEGAE